MFHCMIHVKCQEIETDLVLKLKEPRFVFDLTEGKRHGKVSEVKWNAAEGYKAFRIDPVGMTAPKVTVKGEMKPGVTLAVSAEGPLSTVYNLKVYDAHGVEQWAYRRNSPLLQNWTTELGIPLNAKGLPWRIEVH